MLPIFLQEFAARQDTVTRQLTGGNLSEYDFYDAAIRQIDMLLKNDPNNPELLARQAEFYHLGGHLRLANEKYQAVIELTKLATLTEQELKFIYRFCPLLLTQETEPFPLVDIVAIHHPEKPLIGYHLFWEDDYDFPDDHEPSDHEEIWIEYDPEAEIVTNVSSWFHSRIIDSEAASKEANENGGRAMVRIEWGKHGSLLKGWETLVDPYTNISLIDWMQATYERMKRGGRKKDHPLKRFWPKHFTGSFTDYMTFSKLIDPREKLHEKPLIFKTKWVNAILFTHAIPYNFHPKMEWPERFHHAMN